MLSQREYVLIRRAFVLTYADGVFWPSPCGDPPFRGCPYAAWLAAPLAPLPNIQRFGHDRSGRNRYRCGLESCRRTFLRPPHRSDRIGFKAYMRVEVHLARTGRHRESLATIARRLGVARKTVVTWDQTLRDSAAAGSPIAVPRGADLENGRLARLVQARGDAPYVIAPIDEEWFVQASVGEMRHYVRPREFRSRTDLLALLDWLSDRTVPMAERNPQLQALGEYLREAFHEDIRLTPKPGAIRGALSGAR